MPRKVCKFYKVVRLLQHVCVRLVQLQQPTLLQSSFLFSLVNGAGGSKREGKPREKGKRGDKKRKRRKKGREEGKDCILVLTIHNMVGTSVI